MQNGTHVRRRVVLISPDLVGPLMAGPGIRYTELARSLAVWHDVVLAAPRASTAPPGLPAPEEYDHARPARLDALLASADVVVAPPLPPALAVRIGRSGASWIADLYNPEPFEGLLAHPGAGARRRRVLDVLRIDRVSYAVRAADTFICAHERQRDMWLGYLAASRRIASSLHDRDPQLRNLIGVVGNGVPEAPPEHPAEPVLRGVTVAAGARIVAWNGGLWPWLDPGTVVSAVARLRSRDPRWVLAMAGVGRPGHNTTATWALDDARERLGEDGLHVGGSWTEYARRGDLLLEADVGVCSHLPGTESRFAERLRVLDLVWAGTPVVCTEGDLLAELVAARGLGHVVPPGDEVALADALEHVADAGRASFAGALAEAAADHRWSIVAAPLAARISVCAGDRRGVQPVARALALRNRAAAAARRISRR
jgi:glycosyltransferase involved in cell wall biosynthesis